RFLDSLLGRTRHLRAHLFPNQVGDQYRDVELATDRLEHRQAASGAPDRSYVIRTHRRQRDEAVVSEREQASPRVSQFGPELPVAAKGSGAHRFDEPVTM